MGSNIRYVSTTGNAQEVDLETAVLTGIAPDGGLYVPTQLPEIPIDLLESWKGLTYQELAFEVLSLFMDEEVIPGHDLKEIIQDSFSTFYEEEILPHHTLTSNPQIVVQELFHGPTLSFKDVAMGFVVNLFNYFLKRRNEKRTLVIATSGDTGPAAAFACIGKTNLDAWVFYPVGLITEEQARQMTTIPQPNIHAVGISDCPDGSDDLDRLIAALYGDLHFKDELQLSSVNSINWARVMMQTVHYFFGYLKNCKKVGDPVHFAVPAGAFGNLCAGSMAKQMGLPVGTFIASNNRNDIIKKALTTGTFRKGSIVNCPSSAIDISMPANFWRHIYFTTGYDTSRVYTWKKEYEETGQVTFDKTSHDQIKEGFVAHSITDQETINTIAQTYQQEGYLLDPHGAVAVNAALQSQSVLQDAPIVCLATAHPAKFPEVTKEAIGKIPAAGTHQAIEEQKQYAQRVLLTSYEEMLSSVPATMRQYNDLTK